MSEFPDAFSSKTRKARKSHKCCDCYRPIEKGDSYRYSSGIWNGEPNDYKQCMNCHEIMVGAAAVDHTNCGEGVGFGELKEWFYNHMCRDFKGREFLENMAHQVDVDPENLNLLLKLDLLTD